jgi:membrane protease YdiL (CAAX protease family)
MLKLVERGGEASLSEVKASIRSAMSGRDIPFYNGEPVRISLLGWAIALAMAAAGFAALVTAPTLAPGRLGGWIGVVLFVAAPLAGLRLAAGKQWTALFPRPTARDIWIGLAFAPFTLLISAIVALGVMRVQLTAANPIAAILLQLHGGDLTLFIAATAPQILGEELITIIPFIALLTFLSVRCGLSRKVAILGAWIGSAALFGLLHLSTYQWHLGQVLLIIGTARLVLTIPYLITKNIWSSTIAHITNDWLIFAVVLVAGSAGVKLG